MSLTLTPNLKSWLQAERGIQADADDDTFRKAAGAALMEGKLDGAKLLELTKAPEADAGNALLNTLKSIDERLKKVETQIPTASSAGGGTAAFASDAPELKTKSVAYFDRVFQRPQADPGGGDVIVNVVKAHERYDGTRKSITVPMEIKGRPHPLGGQMLREADREIMAPSQRDKAVIGAYFKWAMSASNNGRVPQQLKMTEHDHELIQYALKEMDWVGVIHGEGSEVEGSVALKTPTRLNPWMQKAILDDSTSGGLEVAPIVFDDAIITTPLLYGEIFPLVNVVNITRGRRIEGASLGTVTLASSTEGTAITLFNTASFIAAFDTNIYVVAGAIEIGLDFLSDSPIDVANHCSQKYGEVLLQWLDNQIQNGDGTTEPEGVRVAAGTVSINATNGAGGPWTVSDYEALLFGITKQYKRGASNDRIAFCGTETTYRRARGIQVGTTDQRRVFGMTHEDYMLLNRGYKIEEHHTNRQVTFTNYTRYRMYRRLGLTIKQTTEGYTLTRANTMLITARARFGGNLEDGSACAYCADGQS